MKRHLDRQWGLAGEYDLLDIGNGFFVVKFDSKEDKTKVIKGIPWEIYDHYLLIRQWTQTFNENGNHRKNHGLGENSKPKLCLPYDKSFLWAIALAMHRNPG
jgi:hypothetical protein